MRKVEYACTVGCHYPTCIHAQAGLTNRFCPSVVVAIVVVVCHTKILKNLRTGNLEAITISKQEVNADIRDTLACLYLI